VQTGHRSAQNKKGASDRGALCTVSFDYFSLSHSVSTLTTPK
jgi:hypothetical protein